VLDWTESVASIKFQVAECPRTVQSLLLGKFLRFL
jgi:hypothetical protein